MSKAYCYTNEGGGTIENSLKELGFTLTRGEIVRGEEYTYYIRGDYTRVIPGYSFNEFEESFGYTRKMIIQVKGKRIPTDLLVEIREYIPDLFVVDGLGEQIEF
jgi:hypothetical protein